MSSLAISLLDLQADSTVCLEAEDYQKRAGKWCAGCGDFGALNAVKRLLAKEQLQPERMVFVSGIGCSSRFPHYVNAYGFHGIHGRALPLATGIKLARPELDVFVVTGDGDCISIGAGHWIHAIRYNTNIVVMMLDIDLGTYPFVTSSNTGVGGIASGVGFPPRSLEKAIGIAKAYCTRVGEGPFPSEEHGPDGQRIREAGNEYGATTGRPRRCGWFDVLAVRYALEINGADGWIVTNLDVLSGFDEVRVVTAYEAGGELWIGAVVKHSWGPKDRPLKIDASVRRYLAYGPNVTDTSDDYWRADVLMSWTF